MYSFFKLQKFISFEYCLLIVQSLPVNWIVVIVMEEQVTEMCIFPSSLWTYLEYFCVLIRLFIMLPLDVCTVWPSCLACSFKGIPSHYAGLQPHSVKRPFPPSAVHLDIHPCCSRKDFICIQSILDGFFKLLTDNQFFSYNLSHDLSNCEL